MFLPPAAVLNSEAALTIVEAKPELLRKSIHFLIAFSPALAAVNHSFTILFLMAGILGYSVMEFLRLYGIKVPVVSVITQMASRTRDTKGFVLGPITLALGAILALTYFSPLAASIGIYALAFGDGFASLVGKLYGTCRPALLFGKSVEGSIACFTATFTVAYLVSRSLPVSFAAAFAATATEALPLGDYDNIALPLVVGVVVQSLLL